MPTAGPLLWLVALMVPLLVIVLLLPETVTPVELDVMGPLFVIVTGGGPVTVMPGLLPPWIVPLFVMPVVGVGSVGL
jgi:hypothetical protein